MSPVYMCFPANQASNFAFMLPVATGPNAIVYSFGHLKVIDMVRSHIIHLSQGHWHGKITHYTLIFIKKWHFFQTEYFILWLFQAKAGFVMKVLSLIVITVAVNTWGHLCFDMKDTPWDGANVTDTLMYNASVTVNNMTIAIGWLALTSHMVPYVNNVHNTSLCV